MNSLLSPRARAADADTLSNRAKRTLSLDLDRQFDRFAVGATWQAFSHTYNNTANTQPNHGCRRQIHRSATRSRSTSTWLNFTSSSSSH